ncbi:MAG: hypothetical protein GY801_49460 [bacterium]|nr:hypothetical protein [bacterium]
MNRQKCVSLCFLMVVGTVLGVFSGEGYSENRLLSSKKTIKDQLFSILDTGSTALNDVEKRLGFSSPMTMRPPTITDPLWWFVYKHQGLLVELGTNTDEPVFTLEQAERTDFSYIGYFQVLTPEEAQARGEHSTYCVPTIEPAPRNTYSTYLREYDMRNPISIEELEIALELGEPVNVEGPAFIDPTWRFYYRVSHCTIRLYGNSLRQDIDSEAATQHWKEYQEMFREPDMADRLIVYDLFAATQHREDVRFTGYWTVGCSTFLDRVKEKFHLQ